MALLSCVRLRWLKAHFLLIKSTAKLVCNIMLITNRIENKQTYKQTKNVIQDDGLAEISGITAVTKALSLTFVHSRESKTKQNRKREIDKETQRDCELPGCELQSNLKGCSCMMF